MLISLCTEPEIAFLGKEMLLALLFGDTCHLQWPFSLGVRRTKPSFPSRYTKNLSHQLVVMESKPPG